MKTILICFMIIFPLIGQAKILKASSQSETTDANFILMSLEQSLLPYASDTEKQIEKIEERPKDEKISKKAVTPSPTAAPTPTPKAVVTPEKLSQGEEYVLNALKRNRERLKKIREQEKGSTAPVQEQESDSLFEKFQREEKRMRQEVYDTHQKWQDELANKQKEWSRAEKEFLSKLDQYKENLFNLEDLEKEKIPALAAARPLSSGNIPQENLSSLMSLNLKAKMVAGAKDAPIRDQGTRPTCAAFAAIHAIEILLAGNGIDENLSEQFFYWASKPQCQTSPCSSKGSWVESGFLFTQQEGLIPSENSCPYDAQQKNNNDTQIPLASSCQRGKVAVNKYKKLKTLKQVLAALEAGTPVVAGFQLSENFFRNKGLVLLKDAGGISGKTHAQGHAITLVGFMELPKKLQASEGKVCFITANSWGLGWGKGGHACLSENWAKKYAYRLPFIAVEAVDYR